MKAFITGGTGFIGSHLIDYLLKNKSFEIYALVRNPNNLKWLKGLNIHFLKGNLFSIPLLPPDIDAVFHIAGLTKTNNPADYYTVNKRGTASLFQALQSQKVSPRKIILLSTLAASGPSFNGVPVKESTPPHPITPYGKSKLLGEKEALKFKDNFPIVILRVGAVYGPRDRDFLSFFKLINRGILPVLRSHQRLVSLCYIKDLVRAFDLSTQNNLKSGEIFHIADPKPYTWDDFGKIAAHFMEKNPKKVKIPLFMAYSAALASELASKIRRSPSIFDLNKYKDMKQQFWIADTEKALRKMSFFPQYSLHEALQETVDWYRQHRWL